jgi:hypothetical protein
MRSAGTVSGGAAHELSRICGPARAHRAGKVLHLNWALVLLLAAVAGVGFLMLYSVAGGTLSPWAEPQMKRFALGWR